MLASSSIWGRLLRIKSKNVPCRLSFSCLATIPKNRKESAINNTRTWKITLTANLDACVGAAAIIIIYGLLKMDGAEFLFSHGKAGSSHAKEVISNVIMHVILFSLFVGFFFFVIARPVEVSVVKRETRNVVKSVVKNLEMVLPPDLSSELISSLATMKVPDMTAQDEEVRQSNTKLAKTAWISLSSVFVVGLGVVLGVYYGSKGVKGYSMKHLMAGNFTILFFVAVTEILFLLMIGSQYRSLDPNAVKQQLLATMRSWSASP